MAYLLYALSFIALVCGTGMVPDYRLPIICETSELALTSLINLVLYFIRTRWIPLLPVPEHIYNRLPSSFTRDLEAGLSSSQFDIAANVADGDPRTGLDEAGKLEIKKIMKGQKVDFDEARRLYMRQRFSRNNISPDGRPRDPKFVSFS